VDDRVAYEFSGSFAMLLAFLENCHFSSNARNLKQSEFHGEWNYNLLPSLNEID
jgi:hypothetical protein